MNSMAGLHEICAFLDSLFGECRFEDDASNNGLQVEGRPEVRAIAFAVDACRATIERAVDAGADMLVVHHGLSWGGGLRRITGIDAARIGLCMKGGLSLYAMHLPLDAHPEIGNNAVLAARMGLQVSDAFFHGIGAVCRLERPVTAGEVLERARAAVSADARLFGSAGALIESIGIVSGGGGSAYCECHEKGIDCLLTGEFLHQHFHPAMEMGISVISAGHYDTENTGIQKLMKLAEKSFPVGAVFLDEPTGL